MFKDRRDAGRQLAACLRRFQGESAHILAVPKGGVMVGREVARALRAPLDVVVARRISAPAWPGLGVAAIAEGGERVIDALALRLLGVGSAELARLEDLERIELARRVELFRGGRPLPDLAGRTAIVVDDGLASGLTARAALRAVAQRHPDRVVLAVPVASPAVGTAMLNWVDDFVCVGSPPAFVCVDQWYENFEGAPETDVIQDLRAAKRRSVSAQPPARPARSGGWETISVERGEADRGWPVRVSASRGCIEGDLEFPDSAPRGVVLFAHGAGSGRLSPRNSKVAGAFQKAGFATLRMDLLTPGEKAAEAETRHFRFNVGLMIERIHSLIGWLSRHDATRGLPLAGFGGSVGAAGILGAAARRPGAFAAIVSRGGRPDLVEPLLPLVRSPTLFIVGARDLPTMRLNEAAFACLGSARKHIALIENATHDFGEHGAMDEVARLAARWLNEHFV